MRLTFVNSLTRRNAKKARLHASQSIVVAYDLGFCERNLLMLCKIWTVMGRRTLGTWVDD